MSKIWLGFVIGVSIISICVCLGQGTQPNVSERMDFDTLVQKLNSGAISTGWSANAALLPKGSVVEVAYQNSKGEWFTVYGVRKEDALVLLYDRDGALYAAGAYGLSVHEQEKWWFANSALLAEHVDLAKAHKKTNVSKRMDFETLVQKLNNGEISAGWDFNPASLPKGPVVDVSYKNAKGERFGLYGVQGKAGLVLLYVKDRSVYAACAYGLSVDEQEKWWFVNSTLLAEHVDLAKAHKGKK